MNLLKDPLRPVYFKYLSAAFGSTMITSVYSIVDMAMVGQYQRPDGTAALAVIAPIWNVIFSLGLLMGIGGSVLFSTVKGQRDATLNASAIPPPAHARWSFVPFKMSFVPFVCSRRTGSCILRACAIIQSMRKIQKEWFYVRCHHWGYCWFPF